MRALGRLLVWFAIGCLLYYLWQHEIWPALNVGH